MTEPTVTPRKRWPWTRIVLVLSLGLNLAVAGLVLGAVLNGKRGPGDRPPQFHDLGFGPFVSALPRADRAKLGEELMQEAGSFRERREALRREFDALLTALRAQPYDHAEVERIITTQQNEILASQRMGAGLLLDHIAGMSDAQRADYADALAKGVRRWKPHPDKRD